MTLDLSNPDHEAALVDACAISRSATSLKVIAANPTILESKPLIVEALAALSSPALAADLIRQLIERAGVSRCAFPYPGMDWMTCCRVKGHEGPHAHCLGNDGFECLSGECMTEDALGERCAPNPALIARLLALPPNAGTVEVLKALRGDNATINAAHAAEVTR